MRKKKSILCVICATFACATLLGSTMSLVNAGYMICADARSDSSSAAVSYWGEDQKYAVCNATRVDSRGIYLKHSGDGGRLYNDSVYTSSTGGVGGWASATLYASDSPYGGITQSRYFEYIP